MIQTDASSSAAQRPAGAHPRICATCVLWRVASNDPSETTGRCFRYPPTSPNGERSYPVTARTDWCGGHVNAGEDTRGFAPIGGRP